MAKLSEEEQAAFEKLKAKIEAPDDEPNGRGRSESLEIIIDLGDENAVSRAIKHGFLTEAEAEELKDEQDKDDDDGEPEKDEAPRRKLDRRY